MLTDAGEIANKFGDAGAVSSTSTAFPDNRGVPIYIL
jgi:hypothetical protein